MRSRAFLLHSEDLCVKIKKIEEVKYDEKQRRTKSTKGEKESHYY